MNKKLAKFNINEICDEFSARIEQRIKNLKILVDKREGGDKSEEQRKKILDYADDLGPLLMFMATNGEICHNIIHYLSELENENTGITHFDIEEEKKARENAIN